MNNNNTLVLVGCGKEKCENKNYAWKMYQNDYFNKKMTVAMFLGTPAILSAKHGYLPVNQRIENYDEDMREKEKHERHSWALQVKLDVPNHYENIIILAGKKYREPLAELLEGEFNVISPFSDEKISGIGDQISWCKKVSEEIEQGGDFSFP